jgi:hypothetical protein
MKISSADAELLHAEEQAHKQDEEWTDGRTDMTRLIFGFRNFANAPNITRSAHTVYLCVLYGSENK